MVEGTILETLKSPFSEYLGFVLIKCSTTYRHRKDYHKRRRFYGHRSLETGGTAYDLGPHEDAPGPIIGKKQGENMSKRLYHGFLGKGKTGKAGLGLASLNNFCGLWGMVGRGVSYLLSSLQLIRAGGEWVPLGQDVNSGGRGRVFVLSGMKFCCEPNTTLKNKEKKSTNMVFN